MFLGGEDGRRGSDRGLSGLVTYPWQRKDQKVGECMNNHGNNAIQARKNSTFGGNRMGSFSLPTKSPMRGVIPLSCLYPRRAKRRLARDAIASLTLNGARQGLLVSSCFKVFGKAKLSYQLGQQIP